MAPTPLSDHGGTCRAVLHYSHHSVGLGHLVRSLAVAGALARRFRVVFCCGGAVPEGIRIPAGVELIQLPPIQADQHGTLTSHGSGLTLDQAWEHRRERLLSVYRAVRPAGLVVELFPFGRAKFAAELLPLLEAARRDRVPAISSVRDLLVAAKRDQQAHDDLAATRLDRYFDAAIVHADPRFARLEETFRPSARPSVPILYSGFVCSDTRQVPREPGVPPEVLVSAGGGAKGEALMLTAAHAQRHHLAGRGLRTRIVTGPFLPAAAAARLRALAEGTAGLTIERFVPELAVAMARAAVSVSQCGYNTSLDLLRSGVPAVVVPYDEARETEQSERARRLGALNAVTVLESRRLGAQTLADSVSRAIDAPTGEVVLDLNGADRTAELVAELVGAGTAEASKAA